MKNEKQIELSFIEKLKELKYIYREDIKDKASLEENFRKHFQELNRVRLSDSEFARLKEMSYICSQKRQDKEKDMAKTEYITVKNASRSLLKRMRQMGEDKAKRLQEIQERWENGEYKDVEVISL